MSESDVICEKLGHCGLITLNRPKALNALNLGMVSDMARAFDLWEADPDIRTIALRGAGERAFCAGGDIKRLYELGRTGDYVEPVAFWRAEYTLDHRIKTYPKPVVALMDGITMGGGAGLGIHARHRVAAETFNFAMPEVGIGFFPDIGAAYFLPRLLGRMGTYLAVTGARIGVADALAIGLVDVHVPTARFDTLIRELVEGREPQAAIAAHAAEVPASTLMDERAFINACFDATSVAAILEKIETHAAKGSAFAAKTRDTILTKSPTSLAIALRQVLVGAKVDLAEALRMDLRIVVRIAQGHDFYEGVRGTLIDRENPPVWNPARIADVKTADIDPYFASLGAEELILPVEMGAA
jgi:enoyl-CoA hydratase